MKSNLEELQKAKIMEVCANAEKMLIEGASDDL